MGRVEERRGRTGSMAMTLQAGLCARLMARERPVTVPPVPAPAMRTSSLREDGWDGVDGVDVMADMISGAVVCSCARGLLIWEERGLGSGGMCLGGGLRYGIGRG